MLCPSTTRTMRSIETMSKTATPPVQVHGLVFGAQIMNANSMTRTMPIVAKVSGAPCPGKRTGKRLAGSQVIGERTAEAAKAVTFTLRGRRVSWAELSNT